MGIEATGCWADSPPPASELTEPCRMRSWRGVPLRTSVVFVRLLSSWEPETCDLVSVWRAVAKSQVPRRHGPQLRQRAVRVDHAPKVPHGQPDEASDQPLAGSARVRQS